VYTWRSDSYTDTGLIRDSNQDAVLDLNDQKLWIVADGMGGHADGGYASQLVTRLFSDFHCSTLTGISKQRLIQRLNDCNTQLVEKAETDNSDIIGCTVALLQARQNSIVCSWSGDSRIYRLRQDQLMQLTRDHSQQCVVEDRDRLRFPVAHMQESQVLTSAIGGSPHLVLEQCWYQLQPGDAFLLCTDGLNKEVSDDEIQHAMIESSGGEHLLEKLAQLYQQRGARDNVGMVSAYHIHS